MDKKALEAGINYNEFRYREADFGGYPKGLMYGLQIMDSWLYDDEKPFIHIEALDTFEFLKAQVGTGYYEELIRKYLLENTHGAIVLIKPEKRTYCKNGQRTSGEVTGIQRKSYRRRKKRLVERSNALEAYQSAPDAVENLEKIPVLSREDISKEIEPIINEEKRIADVPVVYHEIETNGIGYVDVLFDMSGVEEADLPYVGILQGVLGVIDTRIISTENSLMRSTCIPAVSEHHWNCIQTFPKCRKKNSKQHLKSKERHYIKKLPVVFRMMEEILTRSKLGDTKRIREILAMQKSRLLMKFQSSGHTTAVLRAMSYASPSSKLKDMTSGIEFYDKIAYIEEHFEEEKDVLVQKLQMLAHKLFRADNMMISYTAAKEGLNGMEELVEGLKEAMFEDPVEDTRCVLHCEMKNEGFKTASKVQYVARVGNFIDNGADYTGALQILKVILSYDYLWQNIRVKGGAYGCMSGFSVPEKDILYLTVIRTWKEQWKSMKHRRLSEKLYCQ